MGSSPTVGALDISTHTPLAGRDVFQIFYNLVQIIFLLTRPSRDVTDWTNSYDLFKKNFYSHAPRGT